jgi:hypothetical protein
VKAAQTMAALCLALAGTAAQAGVDWRQMVQDCKGEADDARLAACIRKGTAEQEKAEQDVADKADKEREEKAREVQWLVRESTTSISSIVGPKLGDAGASFTYQKDDTKTSDREATVAKLAVFAVLPKPRPARSFLPELQTFFGAGWQRDVTNPQKKKDVGELTTGMLGPIWQSPQEVPAHEAITLLATLQATHRHDRYAATDGDQLRAHVDWSYAPWASGAALGGVSFLPHVAGLLRHRSGGGVEDGHWRSLYAGFGMARPVDFGSHHFKLTWIVRKLYDLKVPDGNAKRRDRYSNLSLEYFFYDPADKTTALQPSLFITRENGSNFLEYGDKMNKTTAGIKLKFN